MKETDENHLVTAYDIAGYLEACGIDAERRSIYKDIEEINKAVLMMEEECTIQEAEEMLDAIEAAQKATETRLAELERKDKISTTKEIF